jgi:hypothetical protein
VTLRLRPSDLFLFRFPKQHIQGVHFSDRETLKSTIRRILGEIDQKVLISVFLDWIERLEWLIQNDGEYYNS